MLKLTSVKFLFVFIGLVLAFTSSSQECGNCKLTPSLIRYDLDVRVPQPKLQGEKTVGWLPWLELFKIGDRILSQLSEQAGNCIQFRQPPSYITENGTAILEISFTPSNLPPAGDLSKMGNYLFTGYISGSPEGYQLHAEIQSACDRKKVAEANVNFKIAGNGDNTDEIASQAVLQLSPLTEKIARFEKEKRAENKNYAIAGSNRERIRITPAKKGLIAGQQTEISIEVKDCDGQALSGREILFFPTGDSPEGVTATTGGTITPAKIVTDAQGKAKAVFKMTATARQSAIINAHIISQLPWDCNGALTGTAQMDLMHSYKVTVSYVKTGTENFNAIIDDDGIGMKAEEQMNWNVHYSYSMVYYPADPPKSGQQIVLMPQFEDQSPELKKMGNTVVLYNNGYSEFSKAGSPLMLTKSPVGKMPPKTEREIESAFSDQPLPPSASFVFENNNLVFFSSYLTFPEKEDGPSPMSGEFGIEKDNKKYFPVKPVKVTDPASPYKSLYEFTYRSTDGYTKENKIFSAGRRETETAVIQIWTTF